MAAELDESGRGRGADAARAGLVLLTASALVAFAANSLLCRMALRGGEIDPRSFTALRVASGAAVLVALGQARRGRAGGGLPRAGSWVSALALFAYAAAFSLAYVTLDTGVGALILFGTVQVTMLAAALAAGERLGLVPCSGLLLGIGGLVYLVLPGITAPDPLGAALMAVAGAAWGVYSVRGRGAAASVAMTAGNFLRATPLALLFGAAGWSSVHLEWSGAVLAILSGSVTSGLGYVVWYRALRDLGTAHASIVQLLVPVLAAFGGVAFLSEELTPRLGIASAFILGGVALAVRPRSSPPASGASRAPAGARRR